MSYDTSEADQRAWFYGRLKDVGRLHEGLTNDDTLFGDWYGRTSGDAEFQVWALASRLHAALRCRQEREAELIALADRRVQLARAEAHERVTELLASMKGPK